MEVIVTGRRLIPLIAFLILFAGCSSSDDGYGDLELTAQNAQPVAAQGLEALTLLEEMSGLVDGFTGMFETQNAQIIPCDTGELDITLTDAVPENEFSTGDSASIEFRTCTFGTGDGALVLSGSLSFTADTVSGSGEGPFAYSLTVEFDDLTVVTPGGTVMVDGGFTMSLSSADGTTLVAVVSGDYLSAIAQGQGATFSGTLTDFFEERTYNSETEAYSYEMGATVVSSWIGGKVTYETTTPFTGIDPDAPDEGVMVVTGANGGTLTITAINSTDVQLVVDTDGEAPPEATIDTTWEFLESLEP